MAYIYMREWQTAWAPRLAIVVSEGAFSLTPAVLQLGRCLRPEQRPLLQHCFLDLCVVPEQGHLPTRRPFCLGSGPGEGPLLQHCLSCDHSRSEEGLVSWRCALGPKARPEHGPLQQRCSLGLRLRPPQDLQPA